MHEHIFTQTQINVHTHLHRHKYTYTHPNRHRFTYTHIQTDTETRTHTFTQTQIYVHTHPHATQAREMLRFRFQSASSAAEGHSKLHPHFKPGFELPVRASSGESFRREGNRGTEPTAKRFKDSGDGLLYSPGRIAPVDGILLNELVPLVPYSSEGFTDVFIDSVRIPCSRLAVRKGARHRSEGDETIRT